MSHIMHAHTRELLAYLDATRAELRDAMAMVPPALRREPPAPGRWSAAQVLAHLALVEELITRMLAEAAAVVRSRGARPAHEIAHVLDRVDRARLTDRTHRLEAKPSVQPPHDADATEAWSALERARAALRELVIASDDLALDHVAFPHPAFGPYDFHQWVAFIGGHEARHAAQIREGAAALGVA